MPAPPLPVEEMNLWLTAVPWKSSVFQPTRVKPLVGSVEELEEILQAGEPWHGRPEAVGPLRSTHLERGCAGERLVQRSGTCRWRLDVLVMMIICRYLYPNVQWVNLLLDCLKHLFLVPEASPR